MEWFDRNDFIVEWTSESVVVPYLKPTTNKMARYFVDFSVVFKESNGTLIKYLIEYKPKKFTVQPVKTKRMSQTTYNNLAMTYAINQSKWTAASEYAKQKNMKFYVITEQHLGISNDNKKSKVSKTTKKS